MTVTTPRGSVRERLVRSALADCGGGAVTPLLDEGGLAVLRTEALASQSRAVATTVVRHDGAERGGSPDRALEWAPGGPALHALYHHTGVRDLLAALTDVEWAPSGTEGTYSYYCGPGHHLGLHRDVEECDLALVVCVVDERAEAGGDAGALCVYPTRAHEPLAQIRATPERGAAHLRAAPGEAVVLLGGLVPHRLPPAGGRHLRVVAPLCYRARG